MSVCRSKEMGQYSCPQMKQISLLPPTPSPPRPCSPHFCSPPVFFVCVSCRWLACLLCCCFCGIITHSAFSFVSPSSSRPKQINYMAYLGVYVWVYVYMYVCECHKRQMNVCLSSVSPLSIFSRLYVCICVCKYICITYLAVHSRAVASCRLRSER